jgi:hypothetical protein
MDFPLLIEELGERSGLDGLRLDEQDSCSVLFDDEHEIEFQWDRETGSVLIWCAVGALQDLSEDLSRRLLTQSAFGAATDGAAFGIYEPLNAIVLWQRQPAGFTDLEDFMKVLERFIAQCAYWKQTIGQPEESAA